MKVTDALSNVPQVQESCRVAGKTSSWLMWRRIPAVVLHLVVGRRQSVRHDQLAAPGTHQHHIMYTLYMYTVYI